MHDSHPPVIIDTFIITLLYGGGWILVLEGCWPMEDEVVECQLTCLDELVASHLWGYRANTRLCGGLSMGQNGGLCLRRVGRV